MGDILKMGTNARITILTLVLLTAVIFIFAISSLRQTYISEKILLDNGKRDDDVIKELNERESKKTKIIGAISTVLSYAVSVAALTIMIFAIVVKNQNGFIYQNGQSLMVVASNSMSAVYDDRSQTYLTDAMKKQEFSFGDILTIDELPSDQDELEKAFFPEPGKKNDDGSYYSPYRYDILVYKSESGINKGEMVVHRFIGAWDVEDVNTGKNYVGLSFRGDANFSADSEIVKISQLKAVYNGSSKVKGIGYPVLFFQSYFGIYAVVSSFIMITLSSAFTTAMRKRYVARYSEMMRHVPAIIYKPLEITVIEKQ